MDQRGDSGRSTGDQRGERRPARRRKAVDLLADGGRSAPRTEISYRGPLVADLRAIEASDDAQVAARRALRSRVDRLGRKLVAGALHLDAERLAQRMREGDLELLMLVDALDPDD